MFINKCMCYGLNIALHLISLAHVQCNNTIYVEIVWISGLSGGFIGEFLQFCCCLFSCWLSEKDTDCTCCVNCILKWAALFESQEYQLSKDIWHVQLFVFEFLCLMTLPLTPLEISPAGRWIRNGFNLFDEKYCKICNLLKHYWILE